MLEKLFKPEYEVHLVCNEKENYTKASGSTASLLTALSYFVNALKGNAIPQQLIEHAVKKGLMSDDELEKHTNQQLEDFINKILK